MLGRKFRDEGLREVAMLSRVLKTVKIGKMTFEQNPEGEGVIHVDNWEKNFSGREKTKCKGPEMENVFREEEGSHLGWNGVSRRERGPIRLDGQIVYRPCST